MAVTNQEITEIAQEAIDSKSPAFVELESFSTKLSDEDICRAPAGALQISKVKKRATF